MYVLQVRNHDKQRWEKVPSAPLLTSDLAAYKWLCAQPVDSIDTRWGWRVREATKAELAKVSA